MSKLSVATNECSLAATRREFQVHASRCPVDPSLAALARNARTRYAESARLTAEAPATTPFALVEQRDLAVYGQMLEVV